MKRFSIFQRKDDISKNTADIITNKLQDLNYILDQTNPDLVISIGGDGTFLRAVHHYLGNLEQILFIGIRTGTLGFYTDYNADEIDTIIKDITKEEIAEICHMPLIEAILDTGETFYALNEIRVENNIRTMVIDVTIDDKFLEKFRGNGLMVCTPTGSTAYNRSLGGPVIDHRAKVMTVTEIAGIHHNSYRALGASLVLSESREVTLQFNEQASNIFGIDHIVPNVRNFTTIKIRFSTKNVQVLRYKKNLYIDRIKKTLVLED